MQHRYMWTAFAVETPSHDESNVTSHHSYSQLLRHTHRCTSRSKNRSMCAEAMGGAQKSKD